MNEQMTKIAMPHITAELKDWKLCFRSEHGYPNRLEALQKLADFFGNVEAESVDLGDNLCFLIGVVYGHRLFDDGNDIITSPIKKLCPTEDKMYYVAETMTGNKYYLNMININEYTVRMFADYNSGNLSISPGKYIDPALQNDGEFL